MDSVHIAFDDTVDSSQENPASLAHKKKMNAVGALECIDNRWYKIIAGKKARWMDLIGDYAGNERFILDGNKTLVWFYVEALTTACPQESHCCNTFSMILCWDLHVLMVSPFVTVEMLHLS